MKFIESTTLKYHKEIRIIKILIPWLFNKISSFFYLLKDSAFYQFKMKYKIGLGGGGNIFK